ncbi:MAG: RsmD family RNA methyltransferase [Betaproteobacteria bacterium]|nr:RsmD family RNA methyltransferase [Betaproteobacteria bacterium]
MRRAAAGRVRIIGGRWRSRRIAVVAGIRPSPDFVRETVFNLLADRIVGATVADLYAGSGALGFEAVSRGALRLLAVDKSRNAVAQLRRTAAKLDAAARVQITAADAVQWLGSQRNLTIVFADPPYRLMEEDCYRNKLLARMRAALGANGIAYLESPTPLNIDLDHWQPIRQDSCGNSYWSLLEATG